MLRYKILYGKSIVIIFIYGLTKNVNYDKIIAWGGHIVLDGSGNRLTLDNCTESNRVGLLNPFRYRSYYYDTETGLYYLQTRYYDPEVGRFITIDDISYLAPDTINGLNLYAYCGNNPVMRVDRNGNSFSDINNATSYIDIIIQMASYVILGLAKNIGRNSRNAVNAARSIQGLSQNISRAFSVAGYALTIICRVQSGLQKGYSIDRIVTDVVFDLTITITMAQIGAWIGSIIPIPVLGTLIGFLVGLGLGYLYSKFENYFDELKESFYNGIVDVVNKIGNLFSTVNNYLERGWNWLTKKVKSWFN